VALALAAALVPAGTAQAAPPTGPDKPVPGGLPKGFTSWSQLFAAQRVLDDAGFRIKDAGKGTSGYAGLRVDVTTRSLTVYWKGQPPAAAGQAIAAARSAGIKVTVMPAKYSKSELDARVALILKDAAATGGERVVTAIGRADGSGIDVGVASAAPSASSAPVQPSAGRSLGHLQQAVQAGGVNVTVRRPAPRFLRESDTPRFWAGALTFNNSDGAACTTGFAATNPNTGTSYILTAGHCGPAGSTWTNGVGAVIGTADAINHEDDALYIPTNSAGRSYDGPFVFQPGQFSKPVRGASHSNVGDIVCLSGSLTGANCLGQVDNTDMWECSSPVEPCTHLIGAAPRAPSVNIAGEGDSGGPVFTLTDNDNADIARGLIHGAYGTIDFNCSDPLFGHYAGFGSTRICSDGVTFTDVVSALDAQGLQIATG
jgi:hypothetical protein